MPFVPLLRVFLTDSDLLGIVHPNVNGGQGLIKIAGVNGYENGLLPILMALGADLFDENGNNGYLKTLKTYTQVLSSDGALLDAILDPLLYLLNALVQDPVHTLLRVLPNVAYFIIDPIELDDNGNPKYDKNYA